MFGLQWACHCSRVVIVVKVDLEGRTTKQLLNCSRCSIVIKKGDLEMKNKTGRVFTSSLKPAWDSAKVDDFLQRTKGGCVVYIINHDRDVNEDGAVLEEHTHIYIEYDTPRKLSTVANLLGVELNFIEIVRNKKGMLRYLTHKDQNTKVKYDDEEVYTNADLTYSQAVAGASMNDRDIAEYIRSGRGLDLLGVVPAGKLRTIQSFLHFDTSKQVLAEIEGLREDVDSMRLTLDRVAEYTDNAQELADFLVSALQDAGDKTLLAAEELSGALKQINRISRR